MNAGAGEDSLEVTSPFSFTFVEDGSDVRSKNSLSNAALYFVNTTCYHLDIFW